MIEAEKIFDIGSERELETIAIDIFRFQAENNPVYKKYLELIRCKPDTVTSTSQIPFLPIEFFKSHVVTVQPQTSNLKPGFTIYNTRQNQQPQTFTSSGTTGEEVSKHFISDLSVYEESFRRCFELFYGKVKDYCILALLPSYLEREGSSLVYMMDMLIKDSGHRNSGFYLHNHGELSEGLNDLKKLKQKTILLGVTYALLDFSENHSLSFPDLIIIETGGMKGKREEMIRAELHEQLRKGFGVPKIHSEYGMTELLSQAYSQGDGIFQTPPWMKIIIHQQNDLFSEVKVGQTGVISVIDLANIYSCSFITTQDVGRKHADGSFEVLGRTDFSDVRGCNLMVP